MNDFSVFHSKTIRMVVSDVDGTLLNSNHEFTQQTMHAVKKLQANGIPFVIATGKSRGSVYEIINRGGVKTPGIYANGLLICDSDGGILEDNHIDPDVVIKTIEYALESNLSYICYSYDSIFSTLDDSWTQSLHKYHEPNCEVVPDLKERLIRSEIKVHKVLFFNDPEQVNAMRGTFEEFLGRSGLDQQLDVTQAVPESIEIMPKGISKATALEKVAKMLSVDVKDTVAFGDGQNDQQMLRLVGVGVAMGNASEETKMCADLVTGSNDSHGVASVIVDHILRLE